MPGMTWHPARTVPVISLCGGQLSRGKQSGLSCFVSIPATLHAAPGSCLLVHLSLRGGAAAGLREAHLKAASSPLIRLHS